MNEYQKAYTEMSKIVKSHFDYMKCEDGEQMIRNFNTLSKPVDKETPLKPRITTTDRIDFNCNCCGAFIGRIQNWNQLPSIENKKVYCSKCGNKIDWSE